MASTNEEREILQKISDLLSEGLPAAYNQPAEPRVPTFFEQNRLDALLPGKRLCLLDIGNTTGYEPLPDQINADGGGMTIKTVSIQIYCFANLLDIGPVNIGDLNKTFGVLDMEQEVFDVLNQYPLLDLDQIILRWKVESIDRGAWKNIEPFVGSTITLTIEAGERDRINP